MFDDDSGADFLPAKLMVMVIVAALLIVLTASGMADLAGAHSEYQARAEADRIYELARLSYAGDCPGQSAGRSLDVSVPSTVRMIAFGAIPVNGTTVRADRSYFIEYSNGRSDTYVSDIPFACDQPDGPADVPLLLYPGKYYLTVSPASLNGSYKACIRAEAA
ncbi:hypothetical protein [Methanocella arvoryzae]|uniref:Uncharacterized protein n=1 Tax=Methanocella arvoryzae (strain DSM 22066 / NBRC 105507 / MRE50) TaxID=351160 RepID=Q0W754_METAR|nr:hypothetical protein [Methanocella arvoryzae]CAJ35789.1 hypothetical protein RCIX331 [Methanocella arvoryzae MRE50]